LNNQAVSSGSYDHAHSSPLDCPVGRPGICDEYFHPGGAHADAEGSGEAVRTRRRGDRVSNCDFVAAKSLIDLAASRLARIGRAKIRKQGEKPWQSTSYLRASPTKESARSRIHRNERTPSKRWRKSAERP